MIAGPSLRGRSRRPRSSMVLSGLAMVAFGALVGLAPVAFGVVGTLAICAFGLALLTVVFLRRAIPPMAPPSPGAPAAQAATTPVPGGDELLIPRLLFYLATLSIAQASVRASGLTVSEALFIASFAGCLVAVVRGRAVSPVPVSVLAGVLIFSFGALISAMGSSASAGAQTEILHAVYVMLLWVWTGSMVLRTRRHFIVAITLWTLSVAVDGVAVIWQLLGVHFLAPDPQGNRMTGFTEHPNDLGGAASVALVPALLVALWPTPGQSGLMRALRWVPVTLIALALVASGSIAGMAGGSLAILIWIASPQVDPLARIAVIAVIGGAVIALPLVGGTASPTERIHLVTSPESSQPGAGSAQHRISVAETIWPRIKESPVVGTGLDTTVTVVTDGFSAPYQIHGAPLAVLYEAGIFGLIGVVILFGAYVRLGWQSLRAGGSGEDVLIGWSLLAALSAFLVFAMTTPFVFQQYGWFPAVMIVAWRLRRDAWAPVAQFSASGGQTAEAGPLRAATT